MRFYMIWPNTGGLGNCLKNAKLIRHRVKDFIGCDRQFFSAEVFAIEKARMCPDRNAVIASSLDCFAHGVGVAGVKPARNGCRSDEREQFFIVSGAFAEIGIKIDLQSHRTWSSIPTRNSARSRSRLARSRCASLRETSQNRTRSPTRSWAAIGRSPPITCAILG